MTDDEIFFAAVCAQFGHAAPQPAAPDLDGFVTGAVISKPKLILATVAHPAFAWCSFDSNRSQVFELPDRSARSLERLRSAVCRFVEKRRLRRVFLRSQSENGKYPGHALNFKIEAALQMVPELRVTFVSSQSISAWVQRKRPAVPEGTPDLGAAWAKKQHYAIETALFTARNFDRQNCFSDGRTDHD
jgi:hypothetical protein